MSAFSSGFYTILSGDTTLTNLLGTFTPTTGSARPAIFTYEPIPKNVEGPYVITVGEISDEPALDTKDSTGRRIVRDIRAYVPAKGSTAAIETIADRIRVLFHRVSVSMSGFTTIYVNVSGPIVLDELDVYGRVLSVELLLATS